MKHGIIDTKYLNDRSRQRKFAAGHRVVSAGNGSVREMYIVISGQVNIYKATLQNTLTVAGTAGPGETFAEAQLFSPSINYLYRTVKETVVYVIDEKTFPQLAKTQPQVVFDLLHSAYAFSMPVKNETETMLEEAAAVHTVQAGTSVKVKTAVPVTPVRPIFPEGQKLYHQPVGDKSYKLVYRKSYTCLNCGQAFEDYRIFASKLIPQGNMRFDTRKYYVDFKPEIFEVIICPHCYFSSFADYFLDGKYVFREKIAAGLEGARNEVKPDFSDEKTIDQVILAHYLALKCSKGFSNRRLLDMRLWSNLSWIYEDLGDCEMERYAARKAAGAGEAAYMELDMSKPQEQVVCLTIGGMLYRSGALEGVMKWLFTAKSNTMGKKAYKDLASNLMDIIRAEKPEEEDI